MVVGEEMIIPELVDGCQLRCALCWNRNRKASGRQMSLDIVKKVIEKYGDYPRLEWFNWGEPLLHKQFVEVSQLIRPTNSRISTNLSLVLSDEYLSALNNFKTVYISLSGMTADTYAIYHIGGNFERVMENLQRYLRIRATKVVIRWLYHKNNRHQFDECQRFCVDRKLHFSKVTLNCEVEDILSGFQHELLDPVKPDNRDSQCRIIKWVPIDVDGRYLLCCASHNVDTGYTIFDDITVEELISIKSKLPLCVQCQQCCAWKHFR